MALYERFVGEEKIARAFTVDGSEEDLRLRALAADGVDGWRRATDPEESGPPVSGSSALFDPAENSVAVVLAYLAGVDPDEAARVLAAEAAGKARKTVLAAGETPATPQEE